MYKVTLKQDFPSSMRALGGDYTPQGAKVRYWQKEWVPIATRVNDVRIFPSQYGSTDYAKFNNIFNSGFQRAPIAVSGSELAFPSPLYYAGQYRFMNPVANTYPGTQMQ